MTNSGFTFRRVREELIETLLDLGIKDFRVLDAISQIPRHIFLDEALWSRAYENRSLTIGYKQTISQPYIVAKMTELLVSHTKSRGKVFKNILEIGSGCGYQSAVLSFFSEEVHAIERIKPLVQKSRENLSKLKINNDLVLSQYCFKDVSVVCHECFSREFQRSFKKVSRVFRDGLKEVSKVFNGSLKGVSTVFQR